MLFLLIAKDHVGHADSETVVNGSRLESSRLPFQAISSLAVYADFNHCLPSILLLH